MHGSSAASFRLPPFFAISKLTYQQSHTRRQKTDFLHVRLTQTLPLNANTDFKILRFVSEFPKPNMFVEHTFCSFKFQIAWSADATFALDWDDSGEAMHGNVGGVSSNGVVPSSALDGMVSDL